MYIYKFIIYITATKNNIFKKKEQYPLFFKFFQSFKPLIKNNFEIFIEFKTEIHNDYDEDHKISVFIKDLFDFIVNLNISNISLRIEYKYISTTHINLLADLLRTSGNKIKSFSFNSELVKIEDFEILSKALASNESIEDLKFPATNLNDEKFLSILENFKEKTHLKSLDVSGNYITATGIYALCKFLEQNKNLEKLKLNKNLLINEDTNLEESLQYIFVGSLVECKKVKNLEFYTMKLDNNRENNRNMIKLANYFRESQVIESINFNFSMMNDRLIEILFNKLGQNGTIKEIVLDKANVSDKAMLDIKIFLCSNKTVEILKLNDNEIYDDGLLQLCEALKENKTLKELEIENNDFKENAFIKFCSCFEVNTKLAALNFRSNSLTTTAIVEFCSKIIKNKNLRLKRILLDKNECDSYSFKSLQKLLIKKKSLIYIGLSYNYLDDHAIKQLIEPLANNKHLLRLDINHNMISKDGYQSLSEIIAKNCSLKYLKMDFVLIDNMEPLKFFLESFKLNKSLETLHFETFKVDEKSKAFDEFLHILKYSSNLTKIIYYNSGGKISKIWELQKAISRDNIYLEL